MEIEKTQSDFNAISVLDHLPAGVAVFSGANLMIEYANDIMLSYWGRMKSEVIKKPLGEVFAEERDQSFLTIAKEVFSTGVPYFASDTVVSLGTTAMQGQKYIRLKLEPRKNEVGDIIGLIAYATDNSAKVDLQKEVEIHEKFSRTVLESSPDCVKVLDDQGHVIFMNFNGMCSMEIEDFNAVKDKPWWTLWGESNSAIVEDSVRKALAGVSSQFQAFCPTLKGTPKWWDVLVSPIFGEGQVVTQILSVSRDITAQREVNKNQLEILTALDKLKTDFFTNISHEFRTPITLLLGPIEELLNTRAIPQLHHSKLEMIRRNALRLQKLVNSLLDFARIESGRVDVTFQPTDICEYTTLLAANFRSAVERAGLKLNINCEPVEPMYINRVMWEKIVFNLLSNALKFTPRGNIDVNIKVNTRAVLFQVRDSGVGITAENQEKIFDRFVRIENVKGRTFEGSGIGLALVKELVKIHGGTIRVKSQAGKGSEFTISIPRGKRHLPAKAIHEFNEKLSENPNDLSFTQEAIGWLPDQPTYASMKRKSEKAKIMLVDDNADMREYINSILKFDYHVTQVSDGAKAKECLEKGYMPDLILSDIMMPEMNGYQFLNHVKSNLQLRNIPFIFLTAKASEDEKIVGLESGVDSYLIKPFSARELLATINSRIKANAIEEN